MLPAADVVRAVGSLVTLADIVGHAVPAADVIVRVDAAVVVVGQMASAVGAEPLAKDDDVAEDGVVFVAGSVVSSVACLKGVVRSPSSTVVYAVANLVVYPVMKNQESQ